MSIRALFVTSPLNQPLKQPALKPQLRFGSQGPQEISEYDREMLRREGYAQGVKRMLLISLAAWAFTGPYTFFRIQDHRKEVEEHYQQVRALQKENATLEKGLAAQNPEKALPHQPEKGDL